MLVLAPTPGQAAAAGAAKGMFTGLVLGIIWGCYEEKKFVLRNCVKEYHLREPPIRLFSVMRRSVTTAPVAATFLGVHAGLRAWWNRRQQGVQEVPQGPGQGPQQAQRAQQQGPDGQQAAAQGAAQWPWLPPDKAHQPVLAGAAGTAAGAVRSLLAEAALAMHPAVHAQRSLVAGLAAAGLFALGGALEEEQRRQLGHVAWRGQVPELARDD